MKNRNAKIVVDILMSLILILELIPTKIITIHIHLIAGLIFAVLFVVHILLNGKWFTSITSAFKSRKLNKKTKWQCVTDWALIIVWILATLTGFPAMGYAVGEVKELIIFRDLHVELAQLGVILIIIHLYQHKSQICSYLKKANTNLC